MKSFPLQNIPAPKLKKFIDDVLKDRWRVGLLPIVHRHFNGLSNKDWKAVVKWLDTHPFVSKAGCELAAIQQKYINVIVDLIS
jgi:hypothetical protein